MVEALKKLFLRPQFTEIYSDWLLEAAALHGKENGFAPFKASALNGTGAAGEPAPALPKVGDGQLLRKSGCTVYSGLIRDRIHCCTAPAGSRSDEGRTHVRVPRAS